MQLKSTSDKSVESVGIAKFTWLIVLFTPMVLLLVGSLRSTGTMALVLWMGTAFQFLGCILALWSRNAWAEVTGSPTIMLYVIALSWLVLGGSSRIDEPDWYYHVSLAALLVVPLILFALQCLHISGATMLRRARHLAEGLSRRQNWPKHLLACRDLPEVKALRENMILDATPALQLLTHPKMQVRVAGLASLEFRSHWEPGQPQAMLHVARNAREPEVRACAILTLGNLHDRVLLEAFAEYLWDPSTLVRQAAKEALMWNLEVRWPWIRYACRQALAHPAGQHDGSLCCEGQLLPDAVVADLLAWTADKGLISVRAAATLANHYDHCLKLGTDLALMDSLREQVSDPKTPSMLRLELARLLFEYREIDEECAWKLLDPSVPGSIRLLAAETLLSGQGRIEVAPVLRELAKTPNREMALATADVVQRCLGIDLGLKKGQPLPSPHSRHALEVTRRVLRWASNPDSGMQQPVLRGDQGWQSRTEI